jgi:hypothetical protein
VLIEAAPRDADTARPRRAARARDARREREKQSREDDEDAHSGSMRTEARSAHGTQRASCGGLHPVRKSLGVASAL